MESQILQTFRDSAIGPSDREGVRSEVFEGREHLVVPVVMIVEGVLNNALVPAEEFGRYPQAWNGRPVPVLHPEREGVPVSANQPDVIERNTIGQLFNTYVDNGKLKGEAWIDTNKAQRIGHNNLLEALEAGEVIEVSTGYFSDSEGRAGTFNGQQYREIHRNIRPDHLALLPNEEGACSVADGCGTRVNRKGAWVKTQEAFNTLAKALGLRANCDGGCTGHCNCNGGDMPDVTKDALVQRANKLHANEKLSSDQMEMLQNLAEDPQQLKMAKAFLDAVESTGGGEQPNPDEMADDEEMMTRMAANKKLVERLSKLSANAGDKGGDKGVPEDKVDEIVANRVQEHLRRHEVTSKLKTNERNPFSEDEMRTMSVEHLEKLEQSIRPADYSGQGGFAANSDAVDADAQPLTIHRGVLGRKEQ